MNVLMNGLCVCMQFAYAIFKTIGFVCCLVGFTSIELKTTSFHYISIHHLKSNASAIKSSGKKTTLMRSFVNLFHESERLAQMHAIQTKQDALIINLKAADNNSHIFHLLKSSGTSS